MIPDEELKAEFAGQAPVRRVAASAIASSSRDLDTAVEPHGFDPDTLLQRMQAFGFTAETMQFMLLPMIRAGARPGRLDGQRLGAGLPQRSAADALRLLQAAVRPGDQPRDRLDPRRDHHVAGVLHRARAEPAGDVTRALRAAARPAPDPHQRGARRDQAHGPPWLDDEDDRHHLPARRGHRGGRARARPHLRRGGAGDRGRLQPRGPVRPRGLGRPRAAQLAAGHRRRAPPPGPQGQAHPDRDRAGDGRGARGPSLLPAGRLRGRRDQPLPGVRGPLAGPPRRPPRRATASRTTWRSSRRIARASRKGMLKVMGKMGISTLQSYKGAQIFEAVGLREDVIDRAFVGTASRVQGVGFETLAEETLRRHALGYPRGRRPAPRRAARTPASSIGGPTESGTGGTPRRSPTSRSPAATTTRTPTGASPTTPTRRPAPLRTLRGLIEVRNGAAGGPIPLDEVEPASEIVKRFCTGAMSFGSISAEAHESLAIAMNRLGGKSNTGEGGEDPERFQPHGQRRLQALGDQAGRLRTVRRHHLVPDQRRRAADQDLAGRQAGRRR